MGLFVILLTMSALALIVYKVVKTQPTEGKEMHHWIVIQLHSGMDRTKLENKIIERYNIDPLMAGIAVGMAQEGNQEWFEQHVK